MPKQTLFYPNGVFHIYNHANGDELLFRKDDNYHYFLKKFVDYLEAILETFAYCLMPDHFHFLIRIRSERVLREYFKKKNLQGSKIDPQGLEINPQGFGNLEGFYGGVYFIRIIFFAAENSGVVMR